MKMELEYLMLPGYALYIRLVRRRRIAEGMVQRIGDLDNDRKRQKSGLGSEAD